MATGAWVVPGYEVIDPPAGTTMKGTVIVIHGGGWVGHGNPPGFGGLDYSDPYVRARATAFQSLGYRTWNVDYATNAGDFGGSPVPPGYELANYEDLRKFVTVARAFNGNHLPIVAWGGSAGGHLALLLLMNTDIDGALIEAGPTNLALLSTTKFAGAVTNTFGAQTTHMSPIWYPKQLSTKPWAWAANQLDDVPITVANHGQPLVDKVHFYNPFAGSTRTVPAWSSANNGQPPNTPNGLYFSHWNTTTQGNFDWVTDWVNVLNAAANARAAQYP